MGLRSKTVGLVGGLSLVTVAAVGWWFYANTKIADAPQVPLPAQEEASPAESTPSEPEPPAFDAAALQAAVDGWAASLPAGSSAGVVLADTSGNRLAEYRPDEPYFAASIYKLFVAYEGYRALDAGQVDPSENFINGHNRAECLDLMIRESDSPCAEKLWVELGKQELTDAVRGYGLEHTSLVNITTSAGDVARMLARVARGEGLQQSSQQTLLDSMEHQVYRDALNKGFSDKVTVFNKIGFNELLEYHDTAIVRFGDGRQLIVSVLTSKVGTSRIAALGRAIEAAVGL